MTAELLAVTPRTVRNWVARSKSAEPTRRPGRPAHSPEAELAAARAVARERARERQGKSVGWRPIAAALPDVPTRLVQRMLAAAKARRRVYDAERAERSRISTQVAGRDVLWSLDATHVGRVEDDAVEAQAVREVASGRTLSESVGEAPDADAAIDVVKAAQKVRGGRMPLVLVTDNGPAYRSQLFNDFLDEEGVLHLFSLPHTPQHNPWVERGNRDLKEESGLGKGVVLADVDEAVRRVTDALVRVDGGRLLRRHGYRTAAAVDAEMAVPYTAEDRKRLRDDVHQRTREALLDAPNRRAVRLAQRKAILEALADHGWITRTRGGRPLRAVKPEGVS